MDTKETCFAGCRTSFFQWTMCVWILLAVFCFGHMRCANSIRSMRFKNTNHGSGLHGPWKAIFSSTTNMVFAHFQAQHVLKTTSPVSSSSISSGSTQSEPRGNLPRRTAQTGSVLSVD